MLRRVGHSLGLVENNKDAAKKDPKGKKKVKGGSKDFSSPNFSSRSSKDFHVKIRHVGGQKELYKQAVPASKLMKKHHGMCVARPEVFKDPHRSVLSREELLLPGHKYILISSKDVEKLKQKHPALQGNKARSPSTAHKHEENNGQAEENGATKEPNRVSNGTLEEVLNTKVDGVVDQSQSLFFFAARDFYVSKENNWTSSSSSRRKGIKGMKPFVPPLPKGRPYRTMGWQPSLPTVEELSP